MESDWKEIQEILSKPLFTLGGDKITVSAILSALVIFLLSIVVSKIAERLVEKALAKRNIDRGIRGSLERFTRYLVVIIGAMVALDTLGVSLTSLAALGAVLMVGIGFGLQNIAQNFISGIILLIERPIKKGDIIKVGDVTGRVLDIRVRATIVTTRDDIALILPNSSLVSELVTNESFTDDKIRIHVRVGVAYGSNTKSVRETLLKVASENKYVLKDPEPLVIFENFGDSSLEFDLRVWITELWLSEIIMSDLRFAVDQAFREKDIVIAFPQRDLHIKSVAEEARSFLTQ